MRFACARSLWRLSRPSPDPPYKLAVLCTLRQTHRFLGGHSRVSYVLRAWLFGVTLEHGRGDFATGRPMPPPLSGVGLIAFQAGGVRLHDLDDKHNSGLISVKLQATV